MNERHLPPRTRSHEGFPCAKPKVADPSLGAAPSTTSCSATAVPDEAVRVASASSESLGPGAGSHQPTVFYGPELNPETVSAGPETVPAGHGRAGDGQPLRETVPSSTGDNGPSVHDYDCQGRDSACLGEDYACRHGQGQGQGRDGAAGAGLLYGLRSTPRTRAFVLREHQAWLSRERDRGPVGRAPASKAGGGEDSGSGAEKGAGGTAESPNPHALAIERVNCSRAVADLIRGRYPAAETGTRLLRYLVFVLLTDPLREDETGEIRFGERVQMGVAGRSFYGGYSGGDLIAEIKGHLPDLEVRSADRRRGREQTIVCDGVDPELRRGLVDALSEPAPQRTYIATDKARRKDSGTYERRDLVASAEAVPAPSPTAAYVRDTLNDRPPNLFTRSLDFEGARAYAAIEYVPRRRPGESEADHAARAVGARGGVLASLNAIEAQPQPIYRCSRRGRTDRVSPCHQALPLLPAAVRAVLAPSFEEHDLRCSYLSVVSALWEFDLLLERLIDEAYTPWQDLVREVAPWHAESHFDELKAAVKDAVYSTVFGMARNAVLGKFTRAVESIIGPDAGRRLGQHWIMEGLFERRGDQLRRIAAHGGWPSPTPTGISAVVDPAVGADEKSVLSTVAMSYEQSIMSAVLEYEREHHAEAALAGRKPDLHVAYWVHDGCGLRFTRGRKRHLSEIRKRVWDRAGAISPAGRSIPAFLLPK